MNKVVITGVTGVVGMALLDNFISKQIEVLVICRKGSLGIKELPFSEYLKVVEWDLKDLENLNLEDRYDIFYHFAWEGTNRIDRYNVNIQNRNVKYTIDAVELAARLGCHTFIGSGSQAEYGRFEGKLNSETPTNPESAYGISKLSAGLLSRIRCNELGIKHIWTRILSIYGPYDGNQTMIMSTLCKLKKGEKVQFTAGEQYWDYLYSQDAAEILFLLGIKGVANKVYCLGSGEARKLREYIYDMLSVLGGYEKVELGAIPYDSKQVMYLCADIKDLQNDIGVIPKTDFVTGIKKTLDHLDRLN